MAIADFQMWATFALIIATLALFARERLPVEITSIGAICAFMVFFHFFPVIREGSNLLDAERLISGFANPAMITVLALLVVGQGMVRTGVLERGAYFMIRAGRGHGILSIAIAFTAVLVISAFLNNIPVVVIFIPILQDLAGRLKMSASKVMMGLSFASILGGMTTLIGSGTNLLVSSALIQAGETPFGFFDFTVPGLVLAAVGLVYTLFVTPRLLEDRTSLAQRIMERGGKYFIGQFTVQEGSPLIDTVAVGGIVSHLPDVRVRMIMRGARVATPPFHDFAIQAGDQLVVAASRSVLATLTAREPSLLANGHTGEDTDGDDAHLGVRLIAEAMVAPASSLIGRYVGRAGFQVRTNCTVLGIERRAQMFRSRMTDIALEPGDVLLVQGRAQDIKALRSDRDVVVLEGSSEALPALHHARRAGAIFAGVVVAAATGTVPVVVAALVGAAMMVVSGALNVRQASRAIDSKILTMIPAALAMGAAMQETGGAQYMAQGLISVVRDAGPAVVLSAFFLFVAILSNVISAKAAAVLFTPIAVGIARELGMDPVPFAVAVVFAANCAIATPIGYQTSLLVMGPGHYRFADYFRAGAPLIILLWLTFSLFAPWYYGL